MLGDTPYASRDIPNCLWENLLQATTCSDAGDWSAERLTRGACVPTDAGARYVQADDLFCGPTLCPVIVGDILVYRDVNHITTEYMSWVAPAFGDCWRPWTAEPDSAGPGR